MSRVHCLDCGSAVVVDPNGLCPDGHLVGTDGARIDAAIGSGVPYPDEPEPWTAKVAVPDGHRPDTVASDEPRAARPPTAPSGGLIPPQPTPPPAPRTPPSSSRLGAPTTAAPAEPAATEPAGTNGQAPASVADDLLRELQSLSDLDGFADAAPPHVSVTPSPSPSPPNEPQLDGLAELRALEAQVQAMTDADDDADGVVRHLPPPDDRTRDEAPDRDQLAEVEDLFAHRARPTTEELPPHRPSQAAPPAVYERPRPSFQRTPWSSLPADDSPPADGPSAAPPSSSTWTPPPSATPGPPAAHPGTGQDSDDPIDLGNFTAKGKRIEARTDAKRRRRGR